MENPKVQTLTETLVFSQKLVVNYISLMKEVDANKVFVVDNITLNSLYWVVGHLAWAENMLILEGTHGKAFDYPWLAKFRFGEKQQIDNDLSFGELKNAAKKIHETALLHLNSLNDADLEKPNSLGFGFGQDPSYKTLIMHHIRHVGTHVGHLGWLCKLHGVKTF